MSPDDVVPGEMGEDRHIADEELQRFFDDLRSAFPGQTPAAADEHLAAMFETAHLLADKGDPVARPVSNADGPAAQVSRLPKRRGNTMTDRNYLRSRALRVLTPAVAAFAVLGAIASANALPHGAQHAASTAASWMGVDLPDGDEATADATDDEAPDASGDDGEDSTKDGAVTPDDTQGDDTSDATESGDQGEDNAGSDDATEASDDQGDDEQGSGDTSESGDNNDQGEDEGGSSGDTENNDSQGEDQQSDSGDDSGSDGSGSNDDSGSDGSSGQD
jgi:hypothetical protein